MDKGRRKEKDEANETELDMCNRIIIQIVTAYDASFVDDDDDLEDAINEARSVAAQG